MIKSLPPLVLVLALTGCVQKMANQPRIEPLEPSAFFDNGMGSRPLVPGTVARGNHRDEQTTHTPQFITGLSDGDVMDTLPVEITDAPRFELRELLMRGRQRYEIFCSHCHDLAGTGRGMVVRRGFPEPPTFHSRRLRELPLGSIFRVITNGQGKMPAHGAQIPPGDRWAIAAYIRALQFSQYADVSELPEMDQQQLEAISENATP